MDAVLLARIQFALTVMIHYIFPTITIGLAFVLFIMESIGYFKKNEVYKKLADFWAKLFGILFVAGVATGIVMEFEFGTNWARYSKFVGDIFGAPLAAEAVFAFFLESVFIGIYFFGRHKIGAFLRWFSSLMISFGSILSAFWIIMANSWQQNPTGFTKVGDKAVLTSFYQAINNAFTFPSFSHAVLGSFITAAFFVAGISAYYLLRKKHVEFAQKSMKVGIIFGIIVCTLMFWSGDVLAVVIFEHQPEKFAALEGVYKTEKGAGIWLFGWPDDKEQRVKYGIKIPYLLSILAARDPHAVVRGLNEFPKDETPPVWLTFQAYHIMIALGSYFLLIMALCTFLLYRKKLFENNLLLKVLFLSIPLPFITNQAGWVASEVGRQPWIVYKLLKTQHGVSPVVTSGEIITSIIIFTFVYCVLLFATFYLVRKTIITGPDALESEKG